MAVPGILWYVTDPHVDDVDYLTILQVVLERLLGHLSKNRTTEECLRSFSRHPSLFEYRLVHPIASSLLFHETLITKRD